MVNILDTFPECWLSSQKHSNKSFISPLKNQRVRAENPFWIQYLCCQSQRFHILFHCNVHWWKPPCCLGWVHYWAASSATKYNHNLISTEKVNFNFQMVWKIKLVDCSPNLFLPGQQFVWEGVSPDRFVLLDRVTSARPGQWAGLHPGHAHGRQCRGPGAHRAAGGGPGHREPRRLDPAHVRRLPRARGPREASHIQEMRPAQNQQ